MHELAKSMSTDVKPSMQAVREVCDAAEQLCAVDLWPFPTYTDCTFGHHFNAAAKGP